MKDGFVKVASCTPNVKVADTDYNIGKIYEQLCEADRMGAKVIVFPELCITAYTCQDLFFQDTLLDSAMKSLAELVAKSSDIQAMFIVGCPVRFEGKLYNCAVVIQHGEILGIIPKTSLPNYNEFYEARHFSPYIGRVGTLDLSVYGLDKIPFGQRVFVCTDMPEIIVGVEICEDLWTADPVSNYLAKAGCTIICNLSASDEVIGKDTYRRQLVQNQSARLVCGYIYSSAGDGESTQDMVFSGHDLIAENGIILSESKLFENGIITSEIDVSKLVFERRKITSFPPLKSMDFITRGEFTLPVTDTKLTRYFSKTPFIPSDKTERDKRCDLILQMQSHGLKKRLEHTGSKAAVLGISGGLDSCLALLVCVKAMDLLKRPHSDIVAVTMPCFGTTKRTRSNAEILCTELGVTFREVDITKSVLQHFEDIGHNPDDHSVVFENGQARERTKILMDIANQVSGFVVGTGDLSELALGWATYNGDHMSMYGVNASIPKTLVRYLVGYYADTCNSSKLSEVLNDILDTPVSPELLPTDDSATEVTQKTEDLVGPYELHDFFLYNGIRWGYPPKKVKRIAMYAFGDDYNEEEITKWLRTFYRRFFAQQFKRSCLPDGAKVGSVTLSPRGDWRMPSDASGVLWQI
ncbi:MAG: NAD(+) synthase [Oscillospiraceae bacterium]|nr:NAD(+) synthase [Oscillospiraceae bacterium]